MSQQPHPQQRLPCLHIKDRIVQLAEASRNREYDRERLIFIGTRAGTVPPTKLAGLSHMEACSQIYGTGYMISSGKSSSGA